MLQFGDMERATIRLATCVAVVILLFLASRPAEAGTIDTMPSWTPGVKIGGWGETRSNQTMGQTFTATWNSLDDFAFQVQTIIPTLDFEARVYAWDAPNQRATGSALFGSGLLSFPSAQPLQPVTINTGGLLLNGGQQYVAFLSVSNFFDGINEAGAVGAIGSDVYTGGKAVFLANGSNPALWTSTAWGVPGGPADQDFAFTANFSNVPEPATLTLLLGGLGVMGVGIRRRR